MADYRKTLELILKQQIESQPVSIIDDPVVPVGEILPDKLFYSEFSEEDAETFFDIYEAFRVSYQDSPKMAVGTLESNLNAQAKAMPKGVCPVDIILYASRLIGKELGSDPDVFHCVRDSVVRNLNSAGTETLRYILGGWTWSMQISIFIEAVGRGNRPELIEAAMRYHPRIVSMCKNEQDKRPLKAYLNMFLETQNENYLSEIVEVVSDPAFAKDDKLVSYFVDDRLKKDPFFRNVSNRNDLIETLLERRLPPKFRSQIERLRYREDRNVEGLTVSDVERMTFGRYSAEDLRKCERANERELRMKVCQKIKGSIDEVSPGEQMGRAYMVLGTKGHDCARDMVRFLEGQKKRYPEYAVPIAIALLDLGEIDENQLFDTLFSGSCPYQSFWGMNLCKYFVYKRHVVNLYADKLLPYVSRCLRQGSLDEKRTKRYLDILNKVTAAVGGNENNSGMLHSPKIPGEILAIVTSVPTERTTDRTLCDTILALLAPHVHTYKVRAYLNKLKKDLGPNMLEIEAEINDMIRRGDQIAPPVKS